MAKQRGLKFPVLKNIKYADIIKNRKTIKRYEGKELEGMEWNKFQEKLYQDVGTGSFGFQIFFTDSNERYSGRTKSVGFDKAIELDTDSNDRTGEVITAIKKLNDSINQKSDSIGVETLLTVTRQGYETQIGFLNSQINYKDSMIQRLELKLNDLENDLNDCDDQVRELENKTGYGQYIELAQKFLTAKFPAGKTATLKESDQTDIPVEVLQILGAVDWYKVQQDQTSYNKLLDGLKNYITLLPLKGQ